MNRTQRRQQIFHPKALVTSLIAIRGQAHFKTCLEFARDTMLMKVPDELKPEFNRMFNELRPDQKRRLVRTVTRNMRTARRNERRQADG